MHVYYVTLMRRIFKILKYLIFSLLVLMALLIIALQFSYTQRKIAIYVKKSVLAEQGYSAIDFERLKIGLTGTIQLYNLKVPSEEGADILTLEKLKINISVSALLRKKVNVTSLVIKGLEGNVYRYKNEIYNIAYLIPVKKSKPEEKENGGSNIDVEVNNVELEDVNFHFHDSVSQVFLDVELGYFKTNLHESDILSLVFKLNKLRLEETKVRLGIDERLSPPTPKERNAEPLLPVIEVGKIKIQDVAFILDDLEKKSYLQAIVDKVNGQDAYVNISDERVELASLELRNSRYIMDYTADTLSEFNVDSTLEQPEFDLSFSGGWTILAGKVSGKNNAVALHLSAVNDRLEIFHPSNFSFENIDCEIRNTSVENKQIKTEILKASANGENGFVLNNAEIACIMTENLGEFKVKELTTNRSRLNANIDISLPLGNAKLADFNPKLFEFDGSVNAGELMYFMPQLNLDKYLSANDNLATKVFIKASDDTILFTAIEFNVPSIYSLKAQGKIGNYKKPMDAYLSFEIDTLNFSGLGEFMKSESATIPDLGAKIMLEGRVDSLNCSYSVSDNYSATIKGNIQLLADTSGVEFISSNRLQTIHLMNYTGDSLLSNLNGVFEISGAMRGNDLAQVSLTATVDTVHVLDRKLQDIQISGGYGNDSITLHVNYEDEQVGLELLTSGLVVNDSTNVKYSLSVNRLNTASFLPGTNYGELTFDAKGGVSTGPYESFSAFVNIPDLTIRRDNQLYYFNPISIGYSLADDLNLFKFNTLGINGTLLSNLSREGSEDLVKGFIHRNINPEHEVNFDTAGVFLAECLIESPEVLQRYLGAIISDTIEIDSLYLNINLQERIVKGHVTSPVIGYKGSKVHDLKMDLDIKNALLSTRLSINEFLKNDWYSNRLEFEGSNEIGKLGSKLTLYDNANRKLTSVPIGITLVDSIIQFGFNNDSVVIGYNSWEYSNNIAISYDFKNRHWFSDGFVLEHENERMEIVDESDRVQAKVDNLKLKGLFSFFSDSQEGFITGGLMSGFVSFDDHPQLGWSISSEIDIDNIEVFGQSYGNMDLKFRQVDTSNYVANLAVNNKTDYFKYQGSFGRNAEQKHEGEVKVVNLSLYSTFIDTNTIGIKEGALEGNLTATFNERRLSLLGFTQFKNTLVYLPSLGAYYKVVDEEIIFTEGGIQFDKTVIEDLTGNQLLLDGNIYTKNYQEFGFDLNVRSQYFQILNTREEQNENLFGELVVQADVNLRGTGNSPSLKAAIRIHDQTNITMRLPGDDPLKTDADEVVRFSSEAESQGIDSLYIVNSLNNVSDSIERVMNTGDFDVLLTFAPKARYKVITNPLSGDYAYFGLTGALSYRTSQTGVTEINGNIQVVDGLYEMSFYEMIRKEFTIEPKSTIYFSGPISNASLDLRAKNIVRTNSLALMSSESVGNSPEEKALYNQRLPYELYFIVEGLLLQPSISFALDLPPEYKQNSPMIASKLNKLSTPEMEQERNMQVFALLVTGGFIAENTNVTSGSGASNVAETTARNSVNSILSQQLNRLTSDNIKYFDMNLGLNTYDDYARRGGQTTTDLDVQISKSLFDDKVSFEMESRINLDGSSTTQGQSSSNYNTDYKLYYNLNDKGSVRAKAYNLSIYDLFDGDITNTGVGITFSRDFEGKKRDNYVELDSVQVNE